MCRHALPLLSARQLPFPYRGPFTFLLPAPSAATVNGSLLHVRWGNHRKGLGYEGGARWSRVGWGWGLTSEKGAEFRGQSSWRELVFALLLGADDFPGGGRGWGRGQGEASASLLLGHTPSGACTPAPPQASLLHGRHAACGRVDLGHSVGTGPLLCPLNPQTPDSGLRCRPLLQTHRPNGGLCQGHRCPRE